MRLGGQLRVAPNSILGWDMTAALALASGLGIDMRAAAELLPEIEDRMTAKLNERLKAETGGNVP